MSAAPRLLDSFRASLLLLRARFGVSTALGAGVVLSLLSVCCGVGAVVAPWLLCELYAVQLALAIGSEVSRSRAWLGAGAVLLGAVLLVASVAWLTWLGLGASPSYAALSAELEPARSPLAAAGPALGALSAAISLVFVLPFLYAPVILIDQRSGIGGAVLESARLVMEGRPLSQLVLSFGQNAVQVSPLWLGAVLSAIFDPERTAFWVVGSLPLMALTLPLGQGMIVASYAERRATLADPSRTRVAGRPPRLLAWLWLLLALAPLLSFGLLSGSLVHPARLPVGALPFQGEEVGRVEVDTSGRRRDRVYPPGTALQVVVARDGVDVEASDGGGAGRLPLPGGGAVEEVRVVRVRDSYGIEVRQTGGVSHGLIDRAGVRLDDDLRSRLHDHVSPWALVAMLLSLLSTAVALLPVLASFARVRRLYTLPVGERPAPEQVSARRARTHRVAGLVAAPLSLLSALSLYFAIDGWIRALGW